MLFANTRLFFRVEQKTHTKKSPSTENLKVHYPLSFLLKITTLITE